MLYELGPYGSSNDAVALVNSKLGKLLDENKLYVPECWRLDECKFEPLPYYLFGINIQSPTKVVKKTKRSDLGDAKGNSGICNLHLIDYWQYLIFW